MMTIVLDAAFDMMEGGDPLWDRLTAEAGQLGSDALARRDLYVKLVERALSALIVELADLQGYEVEVCTPDELWGEYASTTTTWTPRPGDEEYRSIEADLWQEAWDTIDLEAIRAEVERQTSEDA